MSTIKVTRRELITLYRGHEACQLKGRKFTYVIGKNKRKLKKEIESMNEFKKFSPEYEDFLNKLEEMRKKHAEKDGDDKPITKPQILPGGAQGLAYDIKDVDNIKSPFRVDVAKLEKKFDETIKDQKQKEFDFEQVFLEETVNFNLLLIDYNDIPEDDITQVAMDGILEIVRNGPETK